MTFTDGEFLWIPISFFFFFNYTSSTEIYTFSLHDALPIWSDSFWTTQPPSWFEDRCYYGIVFREYRDRKSTRLNSSHVRISYAVFCLKKKKEFLWLPISLSL